MALQIWPYRGIPDNPVGWLYTVAGNKARNYLRKNEIFRNQVTDNIKQSNELAVLPDIDLSFQNITDSQLKMLFVLCHPSIPQEAQIGLSLRILCGFGIDEIANAFLTNRETINKRLYRAKEKLRNENIRVELPAEMEIGKRLDAVLQTLYLLFNEGYYSETHQSVLREDFCLEAMRLTKLLLENQLTNVPKVKALLALMCFHSSRFAARKNETGEIVLYYDQDETLWNRE